MHDVIKEGQTVTFLTGLMAKFGLAGPLWGVDQTSGDRQ